MGYTTNFEGEFTFNKQVDKELEKYVNNFARTRHMLYNTEWIKKELPFWRAFTFDGNLGKNGCLIADENHVFDVWPNENEKWVKDVNDSGDCPSLWANWKIENNTLVWNGAEKFYSYVEWLEFYITNFFEPNDLKLSGVVYFYGEDREDCGSIIIDENFVKQYYKDDYDLDKLLEKYKHNELVYNTLKNDGKTQESFEECGYYWDEYGEDYER